MPDRRLGVTRPDYWDTAALVALTVALTVAIAGCVPAPSDAPSPLDPRTAATARIAELGWLMIALATAVCVVVFAALLGALFRPRPSGAPGADRFPAFPRAAGDPQLAPAAGVVATSGGGSGVVVVAGMVLPALVIVFVLGYTIYTLRTVAGVGGPGAALETHAGGAHAHGPTGAAGAPAAPGAVDGQPVVTVRMIGHQWWWEAEYVDEGVVTANEIHVPAGAPVRLLVTSQDVIHSFWVPQVAGKVDVLPGKTNTITFRVDQPGVYRGLCSEFCGLQHAHMHFHLFVDPPVEFGAWLAAQRRVPPPPPEGSIVAQGQRVFLRSACAECHTVRGTTASGRRGPDLTHVSSRRTLGAATHENTPATLARWVTEPQQMKPGNKMPDPDLGEADARAVVAYLESLE